MFPCSLGPRLTPAFCIIGLGASVRNEASFQYVLHSVLTSPPPPLPLHVHHNGKRPIVQTSEPETSKLGSKGQFKCQNHRKEVPSFLVKPCPPTHPYMDGDVTLFLSSSYMASRSTNGCLPADERPTT